MTLAEKVNISTGTGWQLEECVGQTGSVPRYVRVCGLAGWLAIRDRKQCDGLEILTGS